MKFCEFCELCELFGGRESAEGDFTGGDPPYAKILQIPGRAACEGVERISSNELSQRMKVTASQIRQDLNNFGGFGQQGYGYNVQYLYDEIGTILGLDCQHNVIVVGAGNMGQALANYVKFEKRVL